MQYSTVIKQDSGITDRGHNPAPLIVIITVIRYQSTVLKVTSFVSHGGTVAPPVPQVCEAKIWQVLQAASGDEGHVEEVVNSTRS